MVNYPNDSFEKQKERESIRELHIRLNHEIWEIRDKTGNDVGIDKEIEFIDEMKYKGNRIDLQIKGTDRTDIFLKNTNAISFTIPTKTLNYALNSNNLFFIVLYSKRKEQMYYFDTFLLSNEEREKIAYQTYINLHFSYENNIEKLNNIKYVKEKYFKR